MTAVLLPCAWALAVMAGAWRHRPAPSRVLAFIESNTAGAAPPSPVGRLGRRIRRSAGRRPDPAQDRRVGWAMVGTLLALAVSPVLAIAVAAVSALSMRTAGGRQKRRDEVRVLASVPETIDLFVLAAGAGHPVQRALEMVAPRAGGPVGSELQAAVRRIEHGDRTADALEAAAAILGEPVRPLVGVLCASERYGTPLVSALERLANEARTDRRRRAEIAARRVPVKLLFPLVLCTLPAFALLTVVPLMIGAFGSLRL